MLSDATIRWRARRDVERLKEIRTMHTERFASLCCSQERQTECRDRVAEAVIENIGSDREETGGLLVEDIVEMDTSHFDQQSFSMDVPEEESDLDQDTDETVDQSCNLGAGLHN